MFSYQTVKKFFITSSFTTALLVSSVSSYALKITNDPWKKNMPTDDCHRIDDHIVIPTTGIEVPPVDEVPPTTTIKPLTPTETLTDSDLLNKVYNYRMQVKKVSNRVGRQLTHTTRYVFFGYPIRKMTEYTEKRNEGTFALAKMIVHNFVVIPFIYYPLASIPFLIAIPPVKIGSVLPVALVNAIYFPLKAILKKKGEKQTVDVKVHQTDKKMRNFLRDIDKQNFDSKSIQELYETTLSKMPESEKDYLPKSLFVEKFVKNGSIVMPNVPISFNEFKEGFSEDFMRTWDVNKNTL